MSDHQVRSFYYLTQEALACTDLFPHYLVTVLDLHKPCRLVSVWSTCHPMSMARRCHARPQQGATSHVHSGKTKRERASSPAPDSRACETIVRYEIATSAKAD